VCRYDHTQLSHDLYIHALPCTTQKEKEKFYMKLDFEKQTNTRKEGNQKGEKVVLILLRKTSTTSAI
jgi:hypothetical protein